ncbi:hypothetical protein [Rhodanobacter lindaniclasticus]|nr:hypothetical protein [Rhodanobacter lindaniclasticus]
MDKNVSKAVARADQYCGTYERVFAVKNTWDVIRARLVELEAENERLQDKADKFMWQVRDTCTRAEKAEAMLRDIAGCEWFGREAPATVELITAHLSENGHV